MQKTVVFAVIIYYYNIHMQGCQEYLRFDNVKISLQAYKLLDNKKKVW